MMADVKVYSKAFKNKIVEKAKELKKDDDKPADWKIQKRGLVINHEVKNFTKTFSESFTTFIMSALGVVAALSWNDAIKTAIDTLFPDKSNIIYKFYVAFVVTVIAIVITYLLTKIKPKKC
jgi:hypothetical protein